MQLLHHWNDKCNSYTFLIFQLALSTTLNPTYLACHQDLQLMNSSNYVYQPFFSSLTILLKLRELCWPDRKKKYVNSNEVYFTGRLQAVWQQPLQFLPTKYSKPWALNSVSCILSCTMQALYISISSYLSKGSMPVIIFFTFASSMSASSLGQSQLQAHMIFYFSPLSISLTFNAADFLYLQTLSLLMASVTM